MYATREVRLVLGENFNTLKSVIEKVHLAVPFSEINSPLVGVV